MNDEQSAKPFFFFQPWLLLKRWFLDYTFAPPWLSKRWHHPLIGYVTAVLLQVIAVSCTMLLTKLYPTFAFIGILEIGVIALVALNWGGGPSVVVTLAGLFLINLVLLPPHFSLSFNTSQEKVEALVFLCIGLLISVGASQIERERRTATAERALLNTIIETVPDIISLHDEKGATLHLNQAGSLMAGPGRGTELPTEIPYAYQLHTGDGMPFPVEELPITRALRGETATAVEMYLVYADGQEHCLHVNAIPLRDASGKIRGAVTVSHDITELRRSEQAAAIRASELEAIFEAITDGVFIRDSKTDSLKMNSAAHTLLSIPDEAAYFAQPRDERIPRLAMQDEHGVALPYEQWPESRILRGEVLQGANTADVICSTLDGRILQLSVSGAPIRNQEGELLGAVWVCRDVTERRLLEQRTRKSLEALLAIAEALVLEQPQESSDEIAQRLAEVTQQVLGCQRVSLYAVEPGTEYLHTKAVVGLSPMHLAHWKAHADELQLNTVVVDSSLLPRLRANEAVVVDRSYPPPIPDILALYDIHSLLHVPMIIDNQFVGIISLDYGNADHSYTSEEIVLGKAVAQLAALVIERERLLREREDAHANELVLLEANYRMNEFLGIASHELKTPITTIKGSIQLIERRLRKLHDERIPSLDDEQVIALEEMQMLLKRTDTQTNRLTRLVNDLIDVSRVQANKLQPRIQPCDMVALVSDVVKEQRLLHTQRTFRLKLLPEASIMVQADADRIGQVLTNYISNALKYSAVEKAVEIVLERRGDSVYVAVCDEGPGIAREEQEWLWERFYRVEGITVQSGSGVGLGLGLYICKTIIELHHGTVGVESMPGQGATFWFTLPL